jgi:hypothetical protein
VRTDRVDKEGVVTLRYESKLRHLGIGKAHTGKRVLILVADRDPRVLDEDGEILAHCTIDPANDYQPADKT